MARPVDKLINDFKTINPALSRISLEINVSKSEVVNLNLDAIDFKNALVKINGVLKELQTLDKLNMLSAPILSPAVKASLSAKCSQWILFLNFHQPFFLLKNCLAIPKFFFILKSSSDYCKLGLLGKYEFTLRESAAKMRNLNFNDQPGCKLNFLLEMEESVFALPPISFFPLAACRILVSEVFNNTHCTPIRKGYLNSNRNLGWRNFAGFF